MTSIDIQTLSFPDGSRGTFSMPGSRSASAPIESIGAPASQPTGFSGSDLGDEAASVISRTPTMRPAADMASLVAGGLGVSSAAWKMLHSQSAPVAPFEQRPRKGRDCLAAFGVEFEPLPEEEDEAAYDDRLVLWKSKLKHYIILSASGKPVWSRHGDRELISSSAGVIQAIISFYENSKSPLQAFSAGDARFVVLTEGPLYLVAISKLGESDLQLRSQLEALYMQILSTLTLPGLLQIFANRPSTDLRKPLEGTDPLLSSLADSFTRGSPSVLLGSLECLTMRKSDRQTITNILLKSRADSLLYGLVVAGGRLVSVIRPRRHSLHPSDLQLIFNMLFESDGIRGGGGENWLPICLPAFNPNGYLYMYVGFLEGEAEVGDEGGRSVDQGRAVEEEMAIVLVSPDRESFYKAKKMRDEVAEQLLRSGALGLMRLAARAGRPSVTQIAPGSQVSHFLYKSRANVQFCMASLEPTFSGRVERRRLMTLYHALQASTHAKQAHLKVLHSVSEEASSLAWITPVFEFYCVGGPNLSRASITRGAKTIIQWASKEEQRLFIIGGGVF